MPSTKAPKVRVYELSKALGVSNKDLMTVLTDMFGLDLKSHSSTIDQDIAEKAANYFRDGGKTSQLEPIAPQAPVSPQGESKPAPSQPVSPPAQPKAPEPSASSRQSAPAVASVAVMDAPAPKPEVKPQPQVQQAQQPQVRPQPLPQSPQAPQAQGQPRPQQHQAPQRPGHHPQSQPARQPMQPAAQGRPQHPQQQGRPGFRQPAVAEPVQETKVIPPIAEPLTLNELCQKLRVRETEIIKHLFMKGLMVTVNQTLEPAFATTIVKDFGFEIEESLEDKSQDADDSTDIFADRKKLDAARYKHLQHRPPVVSIMGHVDHGKTSLLDAIRETRHRLVDAEAGGITQTIGAYTVEKDGKTIVFLDTPGHEAFTMMRMRGAKATDVAILVVAADDGVMPQTLEAYSHAKAAQIPIIVAVNKIDKADADPERVMTQLSEHGLVPEAWGGDTVMVEVSALQKLGIDDLLEMILLVTELQELQADPTVLAEGIIIEAQMDKRRGPVATALIQNGTLHVGQNILIGATGGRIRALLDDQGVRIQSAGPSMPVEILGLEGVPTPGDHFQIIPNDKQFKQMLSSNKVKDREQKLATQTRNLGVSAVGEVNEQEEQRQKEFNVVLKCDSQGSLEAVRGSITQLSTDEVQLKIIHSAVGDISEADIMLASASTAAVIGFNVKEDANALRIAEQNDIVIHKFDVIYHLKEHIEKMMLGKLSPETQEVEVGEAEVRQLFTVGKNQVIAGCMVLKGKVQRNARARVNRNGKEIFSGVLNNLKRFKDDAKEVAAGYECGISFDKFNDLETGDIITVYAIEELERTSL